MRTGNFHSKIFFSIPISYSLAGHKKSDDQTHFFDMKKNPKNKSIKILWSWKWLVWTDSDSKSLDLVQILSKILEISLLSLPCDEKFWSSELELEKNKICWEQLSMRSLQICNRFLWKSCFKFCFPYPEFENFVIFSSGNVSHPIYGPCDRWLWRARAS